MKHFERASQIKETIRKIQILLREIPGKTVNSQKNTQTQQSYINSQINSSTKSKHRQKQSLHAGLAYQALRDIRRNTSDYDVKYSLFDRKPVVVLFGRYPKHTSHQRNYNRITSLNAIFTGQRICCSVIRDFFVRTSVFISVRASVCQSVYLIIVYQSNF